MSVSTKTARYWKIDFSSGTPRERKFSDATQMKEECRAFMIEQVAARVAYKASEERWHDIVRFTLASEEFFANFDWTFDLHLRGNVLHMEIADCLNPIYIRGLAYGGY